MTGEIDTALRPSRRQILQGTAATGMGLLIGFHWTEPRAAPQGAAQAPVPHTAFVRIAPDNTVTVMAKHIEFGQGIHSGLATIVAEELDAAWSQVRVQSAPADAKLYNNLLWGPYQGTGGSSSIANSYEQLRYAGATARAMLVEAAAQAWEVPASQVEVEGGVLSHPRSKRTATMGQLSEAAAKLPVPAQVALKDPKQFTLIGTNPPRVDGADKARGRARFTIDESRPGMLTALLARPPRFGGKAVSFDAAETRKVKGVVDVVQTPVGVAVLAQGFWPAKKGIDSLKVTWDDGPAERRGSDGILAEYKRLAEQPGRVARRSGDAATEMAKAARVIEGIYEFPYLAHAPMEPLDCMVELGADRCTIWAGSQLPTVDQAVAAAIAGLKPEQVTVNTLLAGGSFGRRATPNADVVAEAVHIAKAIGGRAPVKLLWTREDDIQGGRYRPLTVHWVRAGLDGQGRPVAWQQRIVGQSILIGTPFEAALVKDGIDATMVEGASDTPYAIPHMAVDVHVTSVGVPVLWWRSVGHTHTAYVVETFIDELALTANKDPYALRRELLKGHPRHLGVLDLAAEKAGWGKPLPKGKARGIAVHESFKSFVAQVAEIAIDDRGQIKVERVVCAVDCGVPINPDVIRAQMEGGIGFGLGAVMLDEISLKDGRVEQSNFTDYPSLRIDQMPAVEVHIVPSSEPPTGVGEPGVPPIGPAVANAVLAATGKRIRALPFARHGLISA
jgi:isoquinoline 1-oxidoreductase beta subunit